METTTRDQGDISGVRVFLFADIRGYTRFTQEQGDEAAARLAAKFAEIARERVDAHGGTVIELRGDEALAVFSSPREALRSAVALQEAFESATREDRSLPFRVGVGLDAGEAIAIEGGYRGGALNLAARLCGLAAAGEVLSSEGVIHLARRVEGLTYLERGVATLKGFADPVRIVEIVPAKESSSGGIESAPEEKRLPIGGFLGALPGAPIVGRDSELKQVLDAVDTVAGGAGRLLVLAGEPGVGKTRLAQEVTLNVRNRDFLLATGRCYESHRTLPFYPFLDALAEAYNGAPEAVRKEVAVRWPHLGKLLPESGITVPPAAEAQEEQLRLFRAVTGFLQTIATERPLALLLDDLHWVDEASLELIQHLARHTRADRIFILGTYRDVEVDRRHPLEGALRDLMREDLVERVAVRRLPREDTAELMAAQFGGEEISDEFRDVVYERTEGNAFFVQHVLRVLVERGDVFRRGEQWTRKDLADIEVPESVLSVIGQRLEQLEPETQEVLREASVLGQTFGFEQLLAMGDRTEKEVDQALEEAQAHGLIRERGADELAFDHALTQQALYQELTARRKRRLHLAAGESLEQLPERQRDGRAGELAWHFVQAGDYHRGMTYSRKAAGQAAAAFAIDDAERQYGTALEMAEEAGDDAGELEIRRLRGQLRLDEFAGKGARDDFERMLALARRRSDQQQEVQALLGLGRAHYVIALDSTDIAAAADSRRRYEEAYRLGKEIGDKASMVRALLGSRWLGDFWPDYREQTVANRKEALAISEEIGDQDLILESRMALWRVVDRETGRQWAEQVRQGLQAKGDLHRLNEHYFAEMWAYTDWGDFEQAVRVCDEGIKLAGEIGVPPVQYPTLKAIALADLGRFDEAWDALTHEVADVEHPFGRAMQMFGAGYLLVQMESFDLALKVLAEAGVLAREVQRAWMRGWVCALRAQALSRSGMLTSEAASEIRAELEATGFEEDEALPEILVAVGKPAEALERTGRTEVLARERGYDRDLVDALVSAARALLLLDQKNEARAKLDEARTLSLRMSALPRLKRIEALRAEVLEQLGERETARDAREALARLCDQLSTHSKNVQAPELVLQTGGER